MSRSFLLLGSTLALALACPLTGQARANTPSPLRLLPRQTDLVLEVRAPRQLIETVTSLKVIQGLGEFPAVEELLSSTQARRLGQLTGYLERELGGSWPQLLDRLAAGGVALGTRLGTEPAPAVLVIQGNDEKLAARFFELVQEVITQELARQESKSRLQKVPHPRHEVVRAAADSFMARAGSVLLVSNSREALEAALKLADEKDGQGGLAGVPEVEEAWKLLPAEPLARLWLNMETARKPPQAAALYTTPREGALTVLLGEYLDVLGRAPHVCAALVRDRDALVATFRVPRGREGMGPELALQLPPEGEPGSLPLLEPAGVLYSDSFYLDLKRIWEDRARLFKDSQARALERADESGGRIPGINIQLSKLLADAGPYHRLVVAHQASSGYSIKPSQPIPSFALVSSMRNPEQLGRSLEGILRGAGLLASSQLKLKLVEEEHRGHKITGYRFPETETVKQDVNNIRFGFSPCFCRVQDQFVIASTLELGRELVDLLDREKKGGTSPAHTRTWIYPAGVADLLASIEDQLVTQAILEQAVEPEDARKQVQAFLQLMRQGGTLRLESFCTPGQLRYDIRYQQ